MAEKPAADGEQRFSVMSHQLVPTHILLNDKEEAEVLGRYKTTKDALPKIKRTDPCVQSLEAKAGEEIRRGRIIKIIRKSETAGIYFTYRIVVD
jgi:DNA-directed RNA polymerase subunit H (RpoH/RPB5)